ncbi:phosphatase 2C-like domain-containing protein [Mycena floridula]|nr:phosphatase 2C-like domain-containing protein [Mycena floridula]
MLRKIFQVPFSRHYSTTRPFKFHVAASWAGKPPTRTEQRLSVPFANDSPIGSWREKMLNSRGKRHSAGEDFFFIQEGMSLGIADGVGGWVESGIDPSLFAQALMYHAQRYTRAGWVGEPEIDPASDYAEREEVQGWELTPFDALDLSYGGVLRERDVVAGSSTACLLTLNSASGLLRAANLGDSGFSIIRASSVIHRQPSQTHFFNCPKQLTKLPANSGKSFSRACIDSPGDADEYQTKLRDGDIVVLYTDGFSDNVFEGEMLTICSLISRSGEPEHQQVQNIADRLIEYSRTCMFKRYRASPFEREAARHNMYFQGGVGQLFAIKSRRVSIPIFFSIVDTDFTTSVTIVVALVRETA